MVFCPIAGGPCVGRSKCRLWIRGRILNTDSKLLAAHLARFLLKEKIPPQESTSEASELTTAFWKIQGLEDIRREVFIDRYLADKVREVEALAISWLKSPGFLESLELESPKDAKVSVGLHTQHCRFPP